MLNSRMIAYPVRPLQCCLVTDGGGALILVAAERARDFPQKLAPGGVLASLAFKPKIRYASAVQGGEDTWLR